MAEMFAKYGAIIGMQWSGRTLGDVIDRYRAEVLPSLSPDDISAQHCYQHADASSLSKEGIGPSTL
jgi:hypothetical protein